MGLGVRGRVGARVSGCGRKLSCASLRAVGAALGPESGAGSGEQAERVVVWGGSVTLGSHAGQSVHYMRPYKQPRPSMHCTHLYSMRLDTAVVCVRSRFFCASDRFQW